MHCTLETEIHIPRLGFHFHIFTLLFKILLLAGERGEVLLDREYYFIGADIRRELSKVFYARGLLS